jgi:hypothetical protein
MHAVQRRSVPVALLCLLALVAAGCAAVPPKNRLYSGDALPHDRLAVLIASRSALYQPQPLIRQIDAQEVERSGDGSAYAELSPGLHVISVGMVQERFLQPSRFSISDSVLRLRTEAGHTYEVKIKVSTNSDDDRWHLEVIDQGTSPTAPAKTDRAQ